MQENSPRVCGLLIILFSLKFESRALKNTLGPRGIPEFPSSPRQIWAIELKKLHFSPFVQKISDLVILEKIWNNKHPNRKY